MDYEKAVKALNMEHLRDITERINTHKNRADIVIPRFVEWREWITKALLYCSQFSPPQINEQVIEELKNSAYVFEDLTEWLRLILEDTTMLAEHMQKSSHDMVAVLEAELEAMDD